MIDQWPALGFATDDPQVLIGLLLGGAGLLLAFLFFRANRPFTLGARRAERPETDEAPAAGVGQRGQAAAMPDDLMRFTIEMHEAMREFSGRVDSKLSALQALIADADRAAARLEAAAALAGKSAPLTCAEQSPPAAAPASRPPADRRKDEIYMLADYGFAPAEIASRTSVPIGEVELMLGLRGNSRRPLEGEG